MSINVIVIDDDDFTRVTVANALQSPEIDVVGTAGNGRGAMELLAKGHVDCSVTDLDLGAGPTGIDLAHGMRRINPVIGIVILTSFSDPRLLTSRTLVPPDGSTYLVKQSLSDFGFLVTAVMGASAGDPPSITQHESEPLSDGQAECLRLLAYGLTNAEIAKIRVVTEKSIERSISRLAQHLGIEANGSLNQRVGLARKYFTMTGAHRHNRAPS